MPISLYIGLGALVAGLLGGWTVRDWKADADALEATQAAAKHEDAAREAIWQRSDQYEQQRAASSQALTQTRETIREIYRNAPPVPAECAASDPVVGVLTRSIEAANAAARGQSEPAMSGPAEPSDAADR